MSPSMVAVECGNGFLARVEAESHANLSACLQCKKCSSGCPVASRADIKAHELVRLAQLGQQDELLGSRMIWECTSCQTCATRCPQQVSIAALNDVLRRMSRAAKKVHKETALPVFNDIFLRTVEKRGRMYEAGLMFSFKLRTKRFFEDMSKVPMMLWKGKIPLWQSKAGDSGERKRLFQRARQAGGKDS